MERKESKCYFIWKKKKPVIFDETFLLTFYKNKFAKSYETNLWQCQSKLNMTIKKKKKKRRLRWANYFVQRCCRGDALFCQEKRSPFDNGNPVKTQTTLHTRQAWSNNYIYEGFIHVIIIIFALTRSCRCIGMFFQAYHTRLEQRLYFIFFFSQWQGSTLLRFSLVSLTPRVSFYLTSMQKASTFALIWQWLIAPSVWAAR